MSTNDIVTSEIFKLSGGAKAIAVHFPQRLEGITSDMAGNYDSPLWYTTEADTTPEGIRHSLTAFRPCSRRMPSTWHLAAAGARRVQRQLVGHVSQGRAPAAAGPAAALAGAARLYSTRRRTRSR